VQFACSPLATRTRLWIAVTGVAALGGDRVGAPWLFGRAGQPRLVLVLPRAGCGCRRRETTMSALLATSPDTRQSCSPGRTLNEGQASLSARLAHKQPHLHRGQHSRSILTEFNR